MKRRHFFFPALLLAVLAGCSSNKPTAAAQPKVATARQPKAYEIGFAGYYFDPLSHRQALPAYLEYLDPAKATSLCAHELVRACMPFQPALVVPRRGTSAFRSIQSAVASSDPELQTLIASLFSSADTTAVRAAFKAAGAQDIRYSTGGSVPRVGFRVPNLAVLDKIALIDGIQYVEVAGRVNED